MTVTRRDTISGAVFALVALAMYQYASKFPVPEGRPVAVGSGFYPRILSVIMAVLALVQIITAIRSEIAIRRSGDAAPEGPPMWKDRSALFLVALTLAMLILYPFAMRVVGFSVTGLIFVGVLVYALSAGKRSGRDLVFICLITIGIALMTFLVFRVFLEIPFPSGMIFRR